MALATTCSNDRPTRVRYWVLAAACCLALLTYVNRLGFSVAASEIKADLGLSDEQMGYLASAFLVAYALFQIPGGLLGDRFGGRNLLTVIVVAWSLLSGATALGVAFPVGAAAPFVFLLILRFLFGICQAAEFPSLARVMADWMPVQERGTAQGAIWTFSRLGGAIVPFLFTWMLAVFGTWPTPFWVMAGLGVLWAVTFWPWFRNRPSEMPGAVNQGEQQLIAWGRVDESCPRERFPWSRFLKSRDVWGLCLMYGFVGFGGNFFTSMLPLYLRDHRGLKGLEFAWLSALPLAAGIVSCGVGGLLSDWIIRRTGSRTWGRRFNGVVGLALAGVATLLIPQVEGVWLLGLLLSTAFFLNDLNIGPAWAACADVGERHTGTISGAMNMVGSLAGAGGAVLAGSLFKRGHDDIVFTVYAGTYCLAALCWLCVRVSKPLADKAASAIPALDVGSLTDAVAVPEGGAAVR
ncbi:MAG TPA: MFS transporter [Gemmataceae bacterium]|nr:MFS transporter [Gemmataceae bacterium]